MRDVLALPGYAPVNQLEVAEAAWSLASEMGHDIGPFEHDNDVVVDFFVGVVEAIDEFIAVAEGRGEWPVDVELRAQTEAAAWVDDFLYDNPGLRFPDVPGDATESALFTVAGRLARSLAAAMAGVRPER